MNPSDPKYAQAVYRLLTIMNELREKCPWDQQQTWDSLRHLTIEETYELSEAVLAGDSEAIKQELGDLLLHIVFYAKIGSEQQSFDFADVINSLCDKVIARHPHVYGEMTVTNEAQVKRNWELLKLKENQGNRRGGVLAGVPNSLPALIKAYRIQQKAHGVGFDWSDPKEVWQKVEEELAEFKQCFASDPLLTPDAATMSAREEEFGDILFSLINYARFIQVDPETALEKTNRKFIQRFNYLEQAAQRDGKSLAEMTLAEMDEYWEEAKILASR